MRARVRGASTILQFLSSHERAVPVVMQGKTRVALGGTHLAHHHRAAAADGERARLDIRRSAFRARHPNPREGDAACRAR